MPYTPAVGDILCVTHACAMTNQVAFNRFFYQVVGIVGAGVSDQAIVNGIDLSIAADYKPLLGNNASYYGTKLYRFAPGPSTLPVVSVGNAGVGTGPNECLPGQVSGLIRATTNLAGPKQRARAYIPFPYRTANDVVLNTPTVGYKAALGTLANNTYTNYVTTVGLNQTTIVPIIYHRGTHTSDLITASLAGTKWATQMRRGNYGRANAYPPF